MSHVCCIYYKTTKASTPVIIMHNKTPNSTHINTISVKQQRDILRQFSQVFLFICLMIYVTIW